MPPINVDKVPMPEKKQPRLKKYFEFKKHCQGRMDRLLEKTPYKRPRSLLTALKKIWNCEP